jgi:hypothetical protein
MITVSIQTASTSPDNQSSTASPDRWASLWHVARMPVTRRLYGSFSGFELTGHLCFDQSTPNLSLVGNDAHAVIRAVVYARRWKDDGVRGEFLEVYELSPLGSATGSFQLAFDGVASTEYRRYYDSLKGAGRSSYYTKNDPAGPAGSSLRQENFGRRGATPAAT